MFHTEPSGDVAVMRFDRAEKKNALLPRMLASLVAAINTAASARAIVLSGVGEVFCSGFDLTSCREDPESAVLGELLDGLSRASRALREAPCPVIVSAHGAAIAGGCALAASADFVLTDEGAKLGYPVVRLGISPAVSGPVLAASIGFGAARARMLDSSLITGRRAVELGFAHECLPTPAACEARALELAATLAAKPRHAMAYTKRWLNTLDSTSDARLLDTALEASMAGVGGQEQREMLAAVWKKSV
jgi:enoyl-CoA hydratase/carnithine racemase